MSDTRRREQREIDREAEEKRQQAIVDAVARNNARIARGGDPDQSGVSGPSSKGK